MLKDNKNKSAKAVLQSGLDAVFGNSVNTTLIEEKKANVNFEFVAINKIKRNPSQPRKIFEEDKLIELSESIKSEGILQPLVLRKLKDQQQYIILAGERRYRAAIIAGLTEVPATIKEINDEHASAIAIIENIQRENLNPIEEADAYQKLLNDFNLTHEEVAKKVGKSRSTITNMLRLLELVEEVRDHVIHSRITYGHARALLGLPLNKQAEIAQLVIANKLSVRDVEKICQKEIRGKVSSSVKREGDLSFGGQRLLEQLEQAFYPLNIKLVMKNSEEGRVELFFSSRDQIQSTLDKLKN